MDTAATAASSLLPALLEKSLTVTILAILLGASLWAILTLWRRANAKETAYTAAIEALHTKRLEDAKEYALGREKSSEYLRNVVDMQNRLLSSVEQGGQADAKNAKLLRLVAAALKIPLENFI